MSHYRWDGQECIDSRDGEIVGKITKWQDKPERWMSKRGGNAGLYRSREEAMAAVENSTGNGATETESPQRTGMVNDIAADVKSFIHDNRNIIYWLALAFLVDHFFLGGAFRQRLNALVEKMIGRVEKQIEAKA